MEHTRKVVIPVMVQSTAGKVSNNPKFFKLIRHVYENKGCDSKGQLIDGGYPVPSSDVIQLITKALIGQCTGEEEFIRFLSETRVDQSLIENPDWKGKIGFRDRRPDNSLTIESPKPIAHVIGHIPPPVIQTDPKEGEERRQKARKNKHQSPVFISNVQNATLRKSRRVRKIPQKLLSMDMGNPIKAGTRKKQKGASIFSRWLTL